METGARAKLSPDVSSSALAASDMSSKELEPFISSKSESFIFSKLESFFSKDLVPFVSSRIEPSASDGSSVVLSENLLAIWGIGFRVEG